MNGIPNPTGEKQITSGKGGGLGRDRGGDSDGEKERASKRCEHKATKHPGTCRARQVEMETKLPLSCLAGGWQGVKDLNLVIFTGLSNISISSCTPYGEGWKAKICSGCLVCWVCVMRTCGRQESGIYPTLQGSSETSSKFGFAACDARQKWGDETFKDPLITAPLRSGQKVTFLGNFPHLIQRVPEVEGSGCACVNARFHTSVTCLFLEQRNCRCSVTQTSTGVLS